jgi:hypothetical protein
VVQFIGYVIKESQPIIVFKLMNMNLRKYLDEKKNNVGEETTNNPFIVKMGANFVKKKRRNENKK